MIAFDAPLKVDEITRASNVDLTTERLTSAKPTVFRGLLRDWPLVKAGLDSPQQAAEYLRRWSNDRPVQAFVAPAEVKGRYFYNDHLDGFNFTPKHSTFRQVVEDILRYSQMSNAPSTYLGSTSVHHILPGLRDENDIPAVKDATLVSIWAGSPSRIAAHYDIPDNLACCAVGRRRFTLFPPEQLENLYIGPLDYTPAGQPASLVDFYQPDLQQFPRFQRAIANSYSVELLPGDALFIPSMWWHHVEGLEDFNVLINYWWRQVGLHMGAPGDALLHALLSIRDLPEAQRMAWKKQFDYYVFDPRPQHHIADGKKGPLNPIDSQQARQLRANLINKLNR